MTVDPHAGTVLRRHFLDPSVTEEVLRATKAAGLAPLVYSYDTTDRVHWIIGEETDGVRRFLADRPGDPRFHPCTAWAQTQTAAVFYIVIIGPGSEVNELSAQLSSTLESACTLNVQPDRYHSMDTWLEVTPPSVSKGTEAQILADQLAVDRIVCFGDNHADIALFEVADEAYAVKDALPRVQAHATGVIGASVTGGVIDWLEEYAR